MEKLNRVTDRLFFLAWSCLICYIAWNSAPADRFSIAAFCVFFIALVGYGLVSSAIRNRKMRQFAAKHDLACTGDSLPQSLSVARTSFALRDYSISNCLCGNLCQTPLVIFDLSHRSGKSTVSQTVVGFPRSGPHAVPEAPIDAVGSYKFEEAGEWVIAWIPHRTVKVDELKDWCIELHTLARDLHAEARGESDARPRLFRWMT